MKQAQKIGTEKCRIEKQKIEEKFENWIEGQNIKVQWWKQREKINGGVRLCKYNGIAAHIADYCTR